MPERRLGTLYICYLTLEDPLVQTQVVAYMRGVAARGHVVHLLTFETRKLTRRRRREIRRRLSPDAIEWHGLRYHKRPTLPATVFDALTGAVYAAFLVRRHRLDVIHARSHVPAAMALIAQLLAWPRRAALIFDIRGLMAEEYEDAGRWGRDSVPFRLTKAVERVAIRRAAGRVVLTARLRRQLFGPARDRTVHVIPCCADLGLLDAGSDAREQTRARMGLGDGPVMIYVGKFGGWYMTAEMAEFFVVARDVMPGLRFLILTQTDGEQIRHALAQRGLGRAEFAVGCSSPVDLGRYLAASDFGISLIKPAPSKVSSSPTKIGEYLGAGLPVVSTAGVGDLDTLITPDVGALIKEHTHASYRATAQRISSLIADPGLAARCRELARRELSLAEVGIPRYLRLYEQVAEESGSVEGAG